MLLVTQWELPGLVFFLRIRFEALFEVHHIV